MDISTHILSAVQTETQHEAFCIKNSVHSLQVIFSSQCSHVDADPLVLPSRLQTYAGVNVAGKAGLGQAGIPPGSIMDTLLTKAAHRAGKEGAWWGWHPLGLQDGVKTFLQINGMGRKTSKKKKRKNPDIVKPG